MWYQVLYIPDHEEIKNSAPKPSPPKSSPPKLNLSQSEQQLASSIESEGTLRSSSMSQPLPESTSSTGPPVEEQLHQEVAEKEESPLPFNRDAEYFEEITDTHMVLVSRYISDDQVLCVRHLSHLSCWYVCRVVLTATS